MKINYDLLGVAACVLGLLAVSVSPMLAVMFVLLAIFCVVKLVTSLDSTEERQKINGLFTDILKQKDHLYESDKGKIDYKLDKETIEINVSARGFSTPVLSLVYDKKTGRVSLKKQNELLRDTTVEQFKQFIFENANKKETKPVYPSVHKPAQKETPFLERLEALQAFRKALLNEVERLDVEARHLLEQTIPEDLKRLVHVMEISPHLDEERLEKLLAQIETVLFGIQASLKKQNDQTIEHLEALFSARYLMK